MGFGGHVGEGKKGERVRWGRRKQGAKEGWESGWGEEGDKFGD